ncbi:mechanosensitive ion channel protein 2, chloroplastic-like isoform X2 [Salvia miltiorrhiza]|uniref:mechanosensitive ion channel protein 2, chloroplastic-like isoform X2 n=1 Tax=Salvia miltiorrhiza TaxID=226208 RepID=UPI0025ACF7F0|nr:mechanosensitive ion channel protein 2, chloroplastic-like isoform X2 [Salvia miltiorrhiza]
MTVSGSLQLSLQLGICRNNGRSKRFRNPNAKGRLCISSDNLPSISLQHYSWSSNVSKRINRRVCTIPCRNNRLRCHCFLNPGAPLDTNCLKNATLTLARSFNRLQGSPLVIKLASAVSIIIFAVWGLGPLVRLSRNILFHKGDNTWKKSSTYQIITSYIQPLLLWAGAIIICRTLDPVTIPTEAGQVVKQRLLNFVRSLSTVLGFAYCLSSLILQAQKFAMETNDPTDTRNMGFQFAGKAIYTAVWVAAVSLFMELLGFSTQKWLTAGGLGTVLLTLAGREIFTNFLSSAMIHATRPFVVNEWIQTKIEGYEVSGTVEHVGWWSPTIVRGEDREAVHIPNHKFTVNVVRNLTQKTHWRIKTHLAISHLDVSKINNIVADMRKVLAKNPQVEQQKLHRRVFLDNINPENQALMIMVSCFVKTSHFEEYLCVKEAILLDLLRVIRHHRARLATPIRTVQKVFTDADLDSVPFSETMYNRGGVSNRPVLLIEPSYKVNGEDKPKNQARSARANGEEDVKGNGKPVPDNKVEAKGETNLSTDSKSRPSTSDDKAKDVQKSDSKAKSEAGKTPKVETKEDLKMASKSSSDPKLSSNTKTVANTENKSVEEPSPTADSSSKQPQKVGQDASSISSPESGGRRSDNTYSTSHSKQAAQTPANKPSLEENIVLGVALDGSKRTLPIEEEMVAPPNPEDTKELATLRSGNGSAASEEKNDSKRPNASGSPSNEQSDQQK